MIYGSVCSGIEAATVAWHPLGWQPAFFSEIDKFPRKVLAHHYPDVPLHGDFTTIQKGDYAAIDLLVGGTPCQSFSVAGLRKGLDDPRGNLMLEFGALAKRLAPRWIVWENVPGVLSSNGGRDFGAFLGMLGELGYGFAYRVLDAQFFGVAQRRRRVFVVGCLGDWRAAAAVLFDAESLRGHPAPGRKAGQEVTPTIRAGAPNGGKGHGARSGDSKDELIVPVTFDRQAQSQYGTDDVASSVMARDCKGPSDLIAHTLRGEGFDASEDGTGRGTPLVAQPYTLAIRGRGDSYNLEYRQDGTANALLTPNGGRGGIGVGAIAHAFDARQSDVIQYGDMTGPLDTCGSTIGIQTQMQVRRLTPRECERLQGFPDDYTLLPGKSADGPRYKALGNSMAVPVMHWIGSRIAQVDAITRSGDAVAA